MPETPEFWIAKESVSARKLNQEVAVLRRLMTVMGWDENRFADAGRPNFIPSIRLGKIVTAGPQGQADYADERYWVREVTILPGAANTWDQIKLNDLANYVVRNAPQAAGGTGDLTITPVYTVTNPGEVLTHTHTLPPDMPVIFLGFHDATNPTPATRWFMLVGGSAEEGPEFAGQVHMGVANETPGWAFLPLVALMP